MWEEAEVIAIFLADIHLSLTPPVWRSAEDDWLEAQSRPLGEVKELQRKYKCPVICAGDIFDRNKKISDGWNAPPELINYAIQYLPDDMYAIPGQHDLPNHQYIDVHRSAYWTLVEAGKIINIPPSDTNGIVVNDCVLFGFPPGHGVKSILKIEEERSKIIIAVVHDYVWITGHSYPTAPEEKKLGKDSCISNREWLGYNVVVYGDNHKGFSHRIGSTDIFNCGTLMRRKSDEIDYKPQVGLLLESGKVVPYRLDISEDKCITKAEEQVKSEIATLNMEEFFDDLEKLGKTSLDFTDAMKEFLHSHKVSNEAKQILFDAMEK